MLYGAMSERWANCEHWHHHELLLRQLLFGDCPRAGSKTETAWRYCVELRWRKTKRPKKQSEGPWVERKRPIHHYRMSRAGGRALRCGPPALEEDSLTRISTLVRSKEAARI